jgi:hypothetical protein
MALMGDKSVYINNIAYKPAFLGRQAYILNNW